jgi:hypothetical protein
MELYRHYDRFGEADRFARDLTRCLMQGIVYRDPSGFAFGEFIEPGHLYICGWCGKNTLRRFLDQYLSGPNPSIDRVSWCRTRGSRRRPAGPYNFSRIKEVIQCPHQ